STRAAWSPLVAARTTIALSPLSRMAPTRAYQVRASIKPRCQHCYDAMRKGRRYILCKKNPKHKQRQG
ncbi:ribosomal protein L36-domain-containing protein, partial [Blastocladiella britannica]